MVETEIKTYSEMLKYKTYKERYEYLKLDGKIGEDTFGHNRHLNQDFYKSAEWKRIRNFVIARDFGCDLGCSEMPIKGLIYIHHMNPITVTDLYKNIDKVLNPEYLVCVSKRTHDAIHFSDDKILFTGFIERTPNDTCPWKQ